MLALDFSRRSERTELMDTEPVSFEEFRACLVDLARVNRMTFAYRPTLAFLERLVARTGPLDHPLTIVDVGSGYGDTLREIHAWAEHRGIAVSLTGVDLNPWSRRAALEATPVAAGIEWVTADAFEFTPAGGIDVVISSLFTHHLDDHSVTRFLRWMEDTARLGWFVNDLHRHPVPYHFFHYFSRIMRFHRFVRHDGPVSIARAFASTDWQRLLATAGIDAGAVDIAWTMPFRLSVAQERRG